jgi:hypothetical protein
VLKAIGSIPSMGVGGKESLEGGGDCPGIRKICIKIWRHWRSECLVKVCVCVWGVVTIERRQKCA